MSSESPQNLDPSQTLLAHCYMELHRGNPGDVSFYREQCKSAGSVLELGVGSARILSKLAAAERVGLDNSPYMLALAQAELDAASPNSFQVDGQEPKLVQLLEGDMAEFDLGRRFDRILVPYNGLLCVPHTEQVSVLQSVRKHLADAGELLFDLYLSDDLHEDAASVEAEPEVDEPEFLVEMDVQGQGFRIFETNSWWPSAQRMEVRYDFEPTAGGTTMQLHIAHHYLLKAQLEPLLSQAGFNHVVWGELPGDEQVTLRARV